MDCRTVTEKMNAWLDGELAPDAATGMREHVHGCPACAARLQELQALYDALGELPGPSPAPDLARDTVRAARELSAARPMAPWWGALNPFAKGLGMAALAAGLVLGVFLYSATFYQTAIASAAQNDTALTILTSNERDFL